jgi:6-pyruvoyltetrahydropterin/6-carboxytetrahydropterin synthase
VNEAIKIELGRRYKFSASHRLHNEQMGAEENERVYGKCNNPYGHGHNYVLEIRVSGKVDAATGMIANLTDLDEFVQREVIDAFDQKSMNEDILQFHGKVPTTEMVCMEIFGRLKHFTKAKLERVRVEETSNNAFECAGEKQDCSAVQAKGNNR